MILVDTSIWVDHLARGHSRLVELLNGSEVLMHPFVLGELALGNLRRRTSALFDLAMLPRARIAMDSEVLEFIEEHRLYASGIGYIDAHLLAATLLTPGTYLWTRDRTLHAAANRLKIAAPI